MSLELNKLTHEVEALGAALARRAAAFDQIVPAARAVLKSIGAADDEIRRKIERAKTLGWPGAIPTDEPVDAAFEPPSHPPRVNVSAADGSQIYPDRHGIALYYLINLGSIVFRHGLAEAPAVRSQPEVFYEDADLYQDDGGQIPNVMIDVRRDVAELGELARLAAAEAVRDAAPSLALLDNGLLLYIALQAPNQRPADETVRDYLAQYLAHLDKLKDSGAAVAGVVDRPRAANVVRLMRLAGLDDSEINEETLRSLGPYERLNDGALFGFLRPGQRGALFRHASKTNLDTYQPRGHAVHFFYLNAGRSGKDNILRIEVPEWVAKDTNKLRLVHAVIVEQCRVPDGFPYVLVRAHELAVVTMNERRDLEQMVIGALLRRGLSPQISQKAQGKAWTAAAKRRFGT